MPKFLENITSNEEVINPMHDKSAQNPNFTNSDITTATDNAIKNCEIITEAMRFNSGNAKEAFNSIKDILENKEATNESKKKLIAEKSRGIEDTALQVYANMAIGMLGSSEEKVEDEKEVEAEARGINKLNTAFDFLDSENNKLDTIFDFSNPEKIVKDNNPKDKRLADIAGAYASLMTDTEIDEETRESIKTAFEETPEIAKIKKGLHDKDSQELEGEGLYNKDLQELEGEELEKTPPIDDLRNSSTYDGENWENFKRKAILSAKGAIAIGLLFAPGGIFLVPIFLYATKNFGVDPEKLEKEQDEEAKELKAQEASKILNAFRNYLPDQKGERQEEGDEQDQNLGTANEAETLTGEKAEEFVEKEKVSLEQARKTLKVNEEALKRVEEVEEVEEVEKTAVSVVDETTKSVVDETTKIVFDEATKKAIASIVRNFGKTNMEEKEKDEDPDHGVTNPLQVDGGARGVIK